ncbi:hypothetical protein [Chryseobacterium sp. CT-SW4]|uniref:hypothetical protein n=1 Tax=Chryseobacterium sp. SW-1 TaxID=3157343 RepID=UPI003B0204C0
MNKQISIFNKNIDLEIGNMYIIFNNHHLLQDDKLDQSKDIFYINLPHQNSIKISKYVESKKLSIDTYEKLIKKYNLKFIEPREVQDIFNQLIYIVISEIENYDILIIGTMGLSFESIKLILQELINIAERYKKIIILVQDTSKDIDVFEKIDELKIKNFESWYVNNSGDNSFIFKRKDK